MKLFLRKNHLNNLANKYKHNKIVDLGCGPNKIEHAVGVDIFRFTGVDIIHDLNRFPYPFPSQSQDLVIMNHVIEHVQNIPNVMKEIFRILKNNGILYIATPHYTDPNSYKDPTHLFHLNTQSFNFFLKPPMNYYTMELQYICLKGPWYDLGYESYLNSGRKKTQKIKRWEKYRSYKPRGDEMRFILRKNSSS